MNDEQPDSAELEEIAGLPPSDPRRRGFESTPRGRALIAAYKSFLDASMEPGALADEADRALEHAIARELGLAGATGTAGAAAGPGAARGRAGSRLLRALMAPAIRPVYALAALAAVVGGLWLAKPWRPAGTALLRGSVTTPGGAGVRALALHPARSLGREAVELSWEPFPGADRYEVSFLGPDMSDLTRVATGPERQLHLGPGPLPAGLSPGLLVQWRVIARLGGDSLGISDISTLRLP